MESSKVVPKFTKLSFIDLFQIKNDCDESCRTISIKKTENHFVKILLFLGYRNSQQLKMTHF